MKTKSSTKTIQIMGLIALINISRNLLWLMPSALMTPIMQDSGLSYTQVGQMSLVVTVMMGVFLIGGSYILEPLGIGKALLIGLGCLAGDGICTYVNQGFVVIMIGKVLCGIGYGMTTCAITALIANSFPPKRLGLMNSVNTCITSLTISLAYLIIVPAYTSLGSWRTEAALWSVCNIIVAVLVLLWRGKRKNVVETEKCEEKQPNNLRAAWRFRSIRCFVLMCGSISLLYVCINSYYPNYLHQVLGFPIATASSMAGTIAIAGVVGSLLMGVVVTKIKRPQITIFIMLMVLSLAFGGMVSLRSYMGLMGAICCFGASYFALNSLCFTCVMHLQGITPFTASAGIALMTACGSLFAIFVPNVQQFLYDCFGLQGAFVIFGALLLPAFLGTALQRNLPILSGQKNEKDKLPD